MNRMIKRLLAAVLITSMLLGSNGISYAAEIADGDSIAGTEEVTQEAVDEEQVESPGDAEASEPANEESALRKKMKIQQRKKRFLRPLPERKQKKLLTRKKGIRQ